MSERRKKKLVENFQGRLIWRMVGYWLIYQVTLLNFLFCWQLLREGVSDPMDQFDRFSSGFLLPSLACFALLVPAFAWDAVKFYHRVAGPVWHFRRTMKTIAAEQPVGPVKLRQGDELIEMQDDFNLMLETLARRGGVILKQSNDSVGTADEPAAFGLVSTNAPQAEDYRAPDQVRRTAR